MGRCEFCEREDADQDGIDWMSDNGSRKSYSRASNRNDGTSTPTGRLLFCGHRAPTQYRASRSTTISPLPSGAVSPIPYAPSPYLPSPPPTAHVSSFIAEYPTQAEPLSSNYSADGQGYALSSSTTIAELPGHDYDSWDDVSGDKHKSTESLTGDIEKEAEAPAPPPRSPMAIDVQGWRQWALVGTALSGLFLGFLDTTIISVALPTISDQFEAYGLSNWVVTSYLLTYMGQ